MAEPVKDKRPRPARGAFRSAGPSRESEGSARVAPDITVAQARILEDLGFFDRKHYLAQYADIASSGVDPFEHFFLHGYKEGRRPNPVFDPSWYIEAYEDVGRSALNPLHHYAVFGERENRRPNPFFDTRWYRATHKIAADDSPLIHCLSSMRDAGGAVAINAAFDPQFYLATYKDIKEAGVDPFEHYMTTGYREGRDPNAGFNTNFYVRRHLGGDFTKNPILHYLQQANKSELLTAPDESDHSIPALVKRFSRPGDKFEDFRALPSGAIRKAKVLAYYLTQFHPISVNDKCWGTGFTEWTNIARGLPRFGDHYQPRIPRDLGFYNLLDVEVMRRQVALAKNAGIYGFVYYYYNFNNSRLLEGPLENFLRASDIDMPFALMWANENWTRRWDGMESEVIVKEDYRPEDDPQLCQDFVRHFKDERYIRVGERPLLMIYRPGVIPNAMSRIANWRDIFRKLGENPLIIMSQAFNDFDPKAFGLDGAVEFPPHKLTTAAPRINGDLRFLDDGYSAHVYAYDEIVERSVSEPRPDFPLIKTVVPSWDNDARRQGAGLCIHGSTPAKYERWLARLVDASAKHSFYGEPFVCVNAWNEWCEGAYLEPDVHFGSAYLNATARAVSGATKRPYRLLLIGHDAFPSGAQHLLLNIGRTLRESMGMEIRYILLGGGELEEAYRASGPTSVTKGDADIRAELAALKGQGFRGAVVNTSAAGKVVGALRDLGFSTVLLIHELPQLLQEKNLKDSAAKGVDKADLVVFPSDFVRSRVMDYLESPRRHNVIVRPQGLYKALSADATAAAAIRREIGARQGEAVVLGAGYADLRKGFDLFLQAWRLCQAQGERVHFCWIGGIDPDLKRWLAEEIQSATATGAFHYVGYRSDVEGFYSAADAFALTSREDPFPSVALEAMSVGVPVVAFDRTGGIPEFLKAHELGEVAPYGDVVLFARSLLRVLARRNDQARREATRRTIEQQFSFVDYARALAVGALPDLPSISVVVPNYNYAHCLDDRLRTIFDQTHPVSEIVVLDDASSDDSVAVIERVAGERKRDLTLVINSANSGSVFAQWARAAESAAGEFVWIAEADDLADPNFLTEVVAAMRIDPSVQIGFSDSRSIDAEGQPVYPSYKPYFASLEPGALSRNAVFEGREFVERFLSVKNVILNVSSVVWRKDALRQALARCADDLKRFKMAGDWRLYVECLSAPGAKIAYVADPLNVHRRHAQSVTHSLKKQAHLQEIVTMHELVRTGARLSADASGAQAAYVGEIRAQFGLADAAIG